MKYASRLAMIIVAAVLFTPFVASAGDVAWISDNNGCKAANPYPKDNESIVWIGECKDGFLHGPGVLLWYGRGMISFTVKGTFNAGFMEGKITIYSNDGITTEVLYSHGQPADGPVMITYPPDALFPKGITYTGERKGGRPFGKATYSAPDRETISGHWMVDDRGADKFIRDE